MSKPSTVKVTEWGTHVGTVTLTDREDTGYGTREWNVLRDGRNIGRLIRLGASLNLDAGTGSRLRRDGVERTWWDGQKPGQRPMYGYNPHVQTRTEILAALIRADDRKQAQA